MRPGARCRRGRALRGPHRHPANLDCSARLLSAVGARVRPTEAAVRTPLPALDAATAVLTLSACTAPPAGEASGPPRSGPAAGSSPGPSTPAGEQPSTPTQAGRDLSTDRTTGGRGRRRPRVRPRIRRSHPAGGNGRTVPQPGAELLRLPMETVVDRHGRLSHDGSVSASPITTGCGSARSARSATRTRPAGRRGRRRLQPPHQRLPHRCRPPARHHPQPGRQSHLRPCRPHPGIQHGPGRPDRRRLTTPLTCRDSGATYPPPRRGHRRRRHAAAHSTAGTSRRPDDPR